MNKWIYLRAAIVALSFFLVLLTPAAQPIPHFGWQELMLIGFASPFMLLFVIAIQARNPRSAALWQRPAWRHNPFNFSEPLQFFDLAAWSGLAHGVAAIAQAAYLSVPLTPGVFVPVTMGAGAWLGVRLSLRVFRAKITPSLGNA